MTLYSNILIKHSKNLYTYFFFFSSRRRHTRLQGDWSSDVCSSDLLAEHMPVLAAAQLMPTGADVTVPPPRTETVSVKKSCTAASTSTWKVKNATVLGTLHCHVFPADTCPVGRISL